ncbi:hypothetical protein Ddye_027725 [Dipteronia dyeriana]|uniref:PGG domain-containing protein n=1 Tax=Dipteronia dyeriana TaxID=168575 RepID=A0AAD9WRQ1_9ROSI|nr:hypothetical protein Ddye_027725 [Dipteronia dyeriana]
MKSKASLIYFLPKAHPSEKEKKDDNGHAPRELFTEQHKDLVDKAEKWMKDTSTSCMVVTTLVATVAFAAAFTVPGGNNSYGFPIFLGNKPFMVFMISDALAVFSRYAEEDFLIKLPSKLLIGLASLFFAITTMLIAFVAALWIVFHDRFKWVPVSITILAAIPVTAFLSLQLPLFFQIYKSTFHRRLSSTKTLVIQSLIISFEFEEELDRKLAKREIDTAKRADLKKQELAMALAIVHLAEDSLEKPMVGTVVLACAPTAVPYM